MKTYWTYIVASQKNGTLYIGVTSGLVGRVWQHKESLSGFTKKYEVHKLVYFEGFGDIELAIRREKRLKKWNRKWKIDLINQFNPSWEDLYKKLF